MAFSLNFTGDFFDSLYSAIEEMAQDPITWEAVASYFEVEAEFLAPSTVYEKARELDTCDDLEAPVSVWLVEGGWITVDVPDTADEDDDGGVDLICTAEPTGGHYDSEFALYC